MSSLAYHTNFSIDFTWFKTWLLVITRTPSTEHVTPVFQQLHWLPVKYHIHFKILLLTFKSLQDCKSFFIRNLLCRLPLFLLIDISIFSIICLMYPLSLIRTCPHHLNLTDTPLKAFVTPLRIKLGIFCLLSNQNHYLWLALQPSQNIYAT